VTGIVANVFGIIGLLTLTGFLPAFARRINLPYTVLLAVVGLGLGGIIVLARSATGLGPLGDFLHALDHFAIRPMRSSPSSCPRCCSRRRSPSTSAG